MAVENLTATRRSIFAYTAANANAIPRDSNMVAVCSTVEVDASASATSTYTMARLPSNARLLPSSIVGWDDLASTGSPTLDVGIKGSQVTNDPDAINDGLDAATANLSGSAMIKDPANWGKPLWEMAGETSDPGGMLEIYISLVDAAVNVGGTLSAMVVYSVD